MTEAEAATVAGVWYRSGLDEYVYLPAFQALTAAEAERVFRDHIRPGSDIWVDVEGLVIRAFMALRGDYIDRLYVDPAHQRLGIATALLTHAMSMCPDGLRLHTHQQNRRARALYEKHGFVAIRFGLSPAPERVPDVEYAWPGSTPAA